MNALFRPATVTSAYLKMGLLGFQGSGKTKTSAKVAIGLVKYMKERGIAYANKPIFFLDSETGSDWVLPDFQAAGIPLAVAKTRSFSDLCDAIPEAEANGAGLIIDSATHYWKELCESYAKMRAQQLRLRGAYRLQFKDWNFLKGPEGWGKFSERFVNSSLHIWVAGRAGYEYEFTEDDDGTKQLEKTGVKMKAEGEFGFEPSLLVQMDLRQEVQGKRVVRTWREANVLKDRSDLIDGQVFENPDFKDFLPHIQRLNLGGEQLGVDLTRTSSAIIPADAPRDRTAMLRAIVLDEINDLLLRHDATGTSKDAQKKRSDLMLEHFGTVSKTAIEEKLPLFDLKAGYETLHLALEGKPSHHMKPISDAARAMTAPMLEAAIDDEIPGFGAEVERQPANILAAG